jgi:hypothetical protein
MALPRVNTRVFFKKKFPPFFGGLPMVNTKVFFSRPFPAGYPWLIPGFFCFFFSPFSGGLPMVNTTVFLFFFRLFVTGLLCMAEPASVYFKWRCPGLIPGFFFRLFRRVAQG